MSKGDDCASEVNFITEGWVRGGGGLEMAERPSGSVFGKGIGFWYLCIYTLS